MARIVEVNLPSGNTVQVRPISIRNMDKVIGLITLVINTLGSTTDGGTIARIVREHWGDVLDLFTISLVNGEADLDRIEGFEDPVVLLQEIIRVNGGPNFIQRLNLVVKEAAESTSRLVSMTKPPESSSN